MERTEVMISGNLKSSKMNQSSCLKAKWKWKSLSCVRLFAVHGMLQARTLEWVAFLISRGSSQPRDRTQVSCTAGGFFTSWATREAPPHPLYFLACLKPPTPFLSSVCSPPLVQGKRKHSEETLRRLPSAPLPSCSGEYAPLYLVCPFLCLQRWTGASLVAQWWRTSLPVPSKLSFLLASSSFFSIRSSPLAKKENTKKTFFPFKKDLLGASLGVQWLRLRAPNSGGQSLVPGQGTRSHMTQLRVCMLQLKKKKKKDSGKIKDTQCCSKHLGQPNK